MSEPDPGDRLEVRVPAGIESKQELLEFLRRELRLPDYFGGNWDAFEECLRDLGWLDADQIAIVHEDVPLAGDEAARRTYLAILNGAVERFAGREDRSLSVTFPSP